MNKKAKRFGLFFYGFSTLVFGGVVLCLAMPYQLVADLNGTSSDAPGPVLHWGATACALTTVISAIMIIKASNGRKK